VDVAFDVRPRHVGEGKRHLDRREIALATSRQNREREVALEQVRALAMAMERSQVKPFDVSIVLAIRAGTRAELEQLDRRLRQPVRDRGNLLVDEAVNILRSAEASARLNDLIQRGRHWGIGVNIVTQLPSDWFGSHLGRRVHGLVDSWWCGQQNPAEVDALAQQSWRCRLCWSALRRAPPGPRTRCSTRT
jgi:hypothetical protein